MIMIFPNVRVYQISAVSSEEMINEKRKKKHACFYSAIPSIQSNLFHPSQSMSGVKRDWCNEILTHHARILRTQLHTQALHQIIYMYIIYYFFFDLRKLLPPIGILFLCGPHFISSLFLTVVTQISQRIPPTIFSCFGYLFVYLALWASSYFFFLACDFFYLYLLCYMMYHYQGLIIKTFIFFLNVPQPNISTTCFLHP